MEDATEAEDTLAMEEDAAALESGAELVGLEAGVDAGVEPGVDESGGGVEAGDVLVSVGVADDTGVDEGVAESTAVEEPVNKENNEVSIRDYNSVKAEDRKRRRLTRQVRPTQRAPTLQTMPPLSDRRCVDKHEAMGLQWPES